MPGIAQYRNDANQSLVNGAAPPATTVSFSCSNGSVSGNGNEFWSNHCDDVSSTQLQKFWSELSSQARRKLLRIDKQTLFEQARKNMYCSRCNGLLLEGFLQIIMYGKSLQHEGGAGHHVCNGLGALKNQSDRDFCVSNGCLDDVQDPSVHPWGGLTTTRDGLLTLLDCYLLSKSLKGLQNVFDSARARERERELLYPDACGGGGRGWISQGMAGYGRGHGTRETCALHTARLSVDTLVDFWSALGEETRQSLLRMKEEDFIERLMYRFDSKRFCRDCRRNVIREFKELKELKRMRKEPRCTSWFCVADIAFQYEVSHDTVQADWHRTFVDTYNVYHHFEWAIGTGEGKSDILDFENVGLSERVQVTGLDLSGLNSCFITLRAWKMDGRCTEVSVKAHALKGQQCVHCRLVVGDGFVTITRGGEGIRRFFEHAEEAEEEEDDDSMDKDGNDLDGECSRPQKHAKSPELAREFLLDAATVIFKEQVEKAFREGTARQNAHSIFVCLALKLLEERVHVACKEIITLEKQTKLLEEEEKEKREEEERKERRRNKEREKKLRRKERLREKDKDKKSSELNQHPVVSDASKEDSTPSIDEESNEFCNGDVNEIVDSIPSSPDIADNQLLDEFVDPSMHDHSDDSPEVDHAYIMRDGDDSFSRDSLRFSRRKLKFRKDLYQDPNLKWPDKRRFAFVSESGNRLGKHEQRHHADNFETSRNVNCFNKQVRNNGANSNVRNGGAKSGEKIHCSNIRMSDGYDSHSCSCTQQNEYRAKPDPHMAKVVRESKYARKAESASEMFKPYYRGNKYNQVEHIRENCGRVKSKSTNLKNSFNRDTNTRRVWEPMESHKTYHRSNSDSDFRLRSAFKVDTTESDQHNVSLVSDRLEEVPGDVNVNCEVKDVQDLKESSPGRVENRKNGFHLPAKAHECAKETTDEEEIESYSTRSSHGISDSSLSSSSNSDNCSSCLSDSNASLTNPHNLESSSTSDSEDASQNSEGRENSPRLQKGLSSCLETSEQKSMSAEKEEHFRDQMPEPTGTISSGLQGTNPPNPDNGRVNAGVGAQPQIVLPSLHNPNVHFPVFQPPTVGYYQNSISWPAAPANGLMPFAHPNHYVYPNPFGYGLNGNTRFMQYGSLQHLTPPLINHGHVPVFQPVANGTNSREPQKVLSTAGLKECRHNEENLPTAATSGEQPREAPTTMETGQIGKSCNSSAENTGFSLFHFGGPVALSTELKSNSVSLKDGITGDISPSKNHPEGDRECDTKNCVEEYNLFAASNGMKFSFF